MRSPWGLIERLIRPASVEIEGLTQPVASLRVRDIFTRFWPDALTWWSVRGGRAGQGAGFASQDLEVVVEVQRLHGQHSMVPGLYLEDLAATDP